MIDKIVEILKNYSISREVILKENKDKSYPVKVIKLKISRYKYAEKILKLIISDTNSCCPNLTILECGDTNEHKHIYCDYYNTVKESLLDQEQIFYFCINRFDSCSYRPNKDSEQIN